MSVTTLIGRLRLLSTILALVAGITVPILSILIVFDIISRSLFRYSLQGTDELGGYTLAIVGSLGFAYTLFQKGHPRIDIFLKFFPKRARAMLDIAAYATLAAFAAFMAVYAFAEFSETIAFKTVTNTPLQTPLWVPQSAWIIGTVFFAAVATACTLHTIWLFKRDPDQIGKLYGPISVEEEVNEYVAEPAAQNQS